LLRIRWLYLWGLILGPLFYSIGLLVSLCANTMLLLWLCNITWSQVLWYLPQCSFCSGLVYIFWVFCGSVWSFRLFFSISVKNVNEDCIESIDCVRLYSHFHNINLTELWIWEVFSSSNVFAFFLQCFIVFIVEVFYLLN
jgi:hypothetical protein